MAHITAIMQALGNEPTTCTRRFNRGEVMTALEYENGDKAGWHTQECLGHWKKTGEPLCMNEQKEGG